MMSSHVIKLFSLSKTSFVGQKFLKPFKAAPYQLLKLNKRGISRSTISSKETVPIIFVDPNGEETTINAPIGKTILEVAQENDIDIEGACNGELACSTCHCIFEQKLYDQLPATSEEEEDMLDLAAGVTDTSRLGCQIRISQVFANTKIKLPEETFNFS